MARRTSPTSTGTPTYLPGAEPQVDMFVDHV
jgi:hypothetical protein